jgi:hypothetical protein
VPACAFKQFGIIQQVMRIGLLRSQMPQRTMPRKSCLGDVRRGQHDSAIEPGRVHDLHRDRSRGHLHRANVRYRSNKIPSRC